MIGLKVNVLGFTSWQHALLEGQQWMRRPFYEDDKLVDKLDKVFIGHEKKVFATKGSVLGAPWPALSPAYAAWKQEHFPGMPIMQRKRRLIRGLTEPTRRDHIAKRNSKATRGEFGTTAPYMKYHQQERTSRGPLPRRPLIGVTKQLEGDYSEVLQDSFYDFMKSRVNNGRV